MHAPRPASGWRTRRCGRPGWLPSIVTSQRGCARVLFSTHTPPSQTTKIASDAGLRRPAIFADVGNSAPMSTMDTVSTTSSPSRTGTSEPTRYVRGLAANRSHATSTIVAVAIPPIRFPAARPRWPDSAAETVTANSGRLPVMASSTIPPRASPRPRRLSSSSVDFASSTPATQVAPDPATKTISTRTTGREATFPSLPSRDTRSAMDCLAFS